jgi:hypothetical protein
MLAEKLKKISLHSIIKKRNNAQENIEMCHFFGPKQNQEAPTILIT